MAGIGGAPGEATHSDPCNRSSVSGDAADIMGKKGNKKFPSCQEKS